MTGSTERIHLDDVAMTPFLRRVTVFSSGGPFLEGYVLSIIGVALTQMSGVLHIDNHWSGLIGVAALVGVFLGASVGGWLTDMVGRKKMFIIDVASIIVFSLLSAFVQNALEIVILRFLVGVVVGADYPIATSMITEFTPRKYRAYSMGFLAAVWYLGANIAYVVGYFIEGIPNGWRWMLASTIVPCVIILLGRWSIPESPRWLMSKGRMDEANEVIKHLFGADVVLDDEPAVKTDIRKVFHGQYLKRVLFVAVIWLCQAIPMFAIYTYGPTIMNAMGVGEGRSQLLGEIIVGTFFLIGTIPAMFLAESWGRRPLVIWSFAAMAVALFILGLLPHASIVVVVVLFGIYALCAGGPGNLQWLYPTELFPTEIRASAMGIATAMSRIGTVVTTYILPAFLSKHGSTSIMIIGAVISLAGFLISVVWAPETKGRSLTETSSTHFAGK
ncbi:MAG: MFS transporter [Bifidobacteriaceae bacterium]|jgi:putative MFS transporter|nr:MFS transporter [Bifidobacteriaceae bacterium]